MPEPGVIDYPAFVTEWLSRRGGIELPSWGYSMFPYMKEGDLNSFEAVCGGLRIGEVYLFADPMGMLIAHRLREIRGCSGRETFIFQGDTNILPDAPVSREQVIGRFAGVRKSKRWIPSDHWRLKMLGWIAVRIPLWPKLMRRYLSLRGL